MGLDVSGRLIVGMIVEESDFWTKAKEGKLSCVRCLKPGSGNFCSACGGKLSTIHAREATPALVGLSRTGEAAEGAWERLLYAPDVGAGKIGIHLAESVIDGGSDRGHVLAFGFRLADTGSHRSPLRRDHHSAVSIESVCDAARSVRTEADRVGLGPGRPVEVFCSIYASY